MDTHGYLTANTANGFDRKSLGPAVRRLLCKLLHSACLKAVCTQSGA
jgi:hypothetical protein